MKDPEIRITVSSNNGAYLLSSDSERKKWKKQGPFLKDEDVNNVTNDKNGRLFASTLSNGVFLSDDDGKTWKPSNRGLHVKKVWTVESDPKENGIVYAGTHYGHLFKSNDRGENWEEVDGLHEAPNRKDWGIDWGFGTIGLALHTVKFDPAVRNKLYIVSSGGGPYLSNDAGKTWSLLRDGVSDSCPDAATYYSQEGKTKEENVKEHLDNVHKCTHKLAISSKSPGKIFQQNHCGVYVSENSGTRWKDISIGPGIRHGFATTLIEDGDSSLFMLPAYQGKCEKHNSCISGPLEVYRTDDSGKAWKNVSNGLPKSVHTCVLRDSMSHDYSEEPGVYFGTTSGEVYGTFNRGKTWTKIASGLNRVQGVTGLTV